MKILAITACTAGIAHTYIAKEKLENAAKELGDTIKVETQGSIGVENEFTPEEIKEADVILVMRDGHIIEQGSHEELLSKGGFYAQLYNSQFALA